MTILASISRRCRASYCLGVLLGVILLGLIVWMSARGGLADLGALTFSPNEVDNTAKLMFEGDHISLEFVLRNETWATVNIDKFETSCRCTKLSAEDGRAMPFTIKSGDTVRCIADVDGEPSFNDLQVGLVASGTAGSRAVRATASILLRVKKSIEADPPVISFGERSRQSETFKETVRLMRRRDAKISGIKSVGFSNPNGTRLFAVSEPSKDERATTGDVLPFFNLVIVIDPSKLGEKVSEKITVEFDQGKPLVIPIFGWVSGESTATAE